MSAVNSRHISLQALDDYINAGVAVSIPIGGEPSALLTVDVPNEVLRLELSWDGETPPLSDYVHIATDVRYRNGHNWATLSVRGLKFFAEAYPLLCSVADLVQLDSVPFRVAVEQSLASYHELLAASARMPVRDEIGLYGELLVVSHLLTCMPPDAVLASWRGGDQHEEHDFGLPNDDIEVKTTTADTRRHWIGSLGQLEPTLVRPLWLLSIQVTGGGVGEGANRLPDIIDRISHQLPLSLHDAFGVRLDGTKYRRSQPRSTFRLLRLRSRPVVYKVDAGFPRLTEATLLQGRAQVERIRDVSYTVHLEGVNAAEHPPEILKFFIEKEGPLA